MKQLIFALLLLPLSASAGLTLTCNGRELVRGNQGRRGTVVISAQKKYEGTVDKFYEISAHWQGEEGVLIGEGVNCGLAVPNEMECVTQGYQQGDLAFSANQVCGPVSHALGTPRYPFESGLVLDGSGGHGRISCSANSQSKLVSHTVELSGCHR